MVDGIVEHAAGEALDGEPLVVAAIAGPLPRRASHPGQGFAQSTLSVD